MPDAVRLLGSPTLFGDTEYSYAATAAAGSRFVFLAGSCPLDGDGRTLFPGDAIAQASAALRNMSVVLADSGAGLGDVIVTRVSVATASRDELVSVWAMVRDFFAPHTPPSTLVGVTVLGYPGQLVEIEATAVIAPPGAVARGVSDGPVA